MVHFQKHHPNFQLTQKQDKGNKALSFEKKITTESILLLEKDGPENESEDVFTLSILSDGFPIAPFFSFVFSSLISEDKKTFTDYAFVVESPHVPHWILDRSIQI